MTERRASLTERVLEQMIARIRSGEWKPGTVLPGQRELVKELGVSRVPLREALATMKGLGLVGIHQGRKTVIRRMNTEVFEELFPLFFKLEGQESFMQIFEMRLAVETRTAYLAAQLRTEDDIAALTELTRWFRALTDSEGTEFNQVDLAFHVRTAEATRNPLFPLLLKTFSRFIIFASSASSRNVPDRRRRAVVAHESILDAIADGDAQRAAVEMEAHLRYSASRRLKDDEESRGDP